MENWFREVLLVIGAMLLIFIELFVPSGGALAIAALLCFGYAIYTLFADGQATVGWVMLISMVVYSFVIFRYWIAKIRLGDTLATSVATGDDVTAASSMIGSRGTTLTELRPSGVAKIGGKRYDVITDGTFLDKGEAVEVVETSGNRIVVRVAKS